MQHSQLKKTEAIPVIILVLLFLVTLGSLITILLVPDITGSYHIARSFDISRAQDHMQILSSPEFAGRLSGSDGNHRALEYLQKEFRQLGLEPPGEIDDGYLQSYRTIVPLIDSAASFRINRGENEQPLNLNMYEDYSIHSDLYGSGLDFSGEILLCSQNLNRYPREMLRDRLLIIRRPGYIIPSLETARMSGAAGLLFINPVSWFGSRKIQLAEQKQIDIHNKISADFFSGDLSPSAFGQIKEFALDYNGELLVPDVRVSIDIQFPVRQTANLLALLPGESAFSGKPSDETIIISADMDGPGRGSENIYFPAASNQAASSAVILELARAVAASPVPPRQNILFALWNSSETNHRGAEFYSENPLMPLESSRIIHLQDTGSPSIASALESDGRNSGILTSLVSQYAAHKGIPVTRTVSQTESSLMPFMDKRIPAIVLSGTEPAPAGIYDNAASVDIAAMELRGELLADYLQYEVFPVPILSVVPESLLTLAAVFLLLVLAMAIIRKISMVPGVSGNWELLYFHPIIHGTRKIFAFLLPVALAMFLFILIIHLPPDSQVDTETGRDSISPYLVLKYSWNFVISLFNGELQTSADSGSMLNILFTSGKESMRLITGALLVSALASVLTGLRGLTRKNAFSANKQQISFSGIIGSSVPDIVVILIMLYIYVAVSNMLPELSRSMALKQNLFPIISISILPAAYSARMTSLRMEEELKQPYILAARARGLSPLQIFRTQLIRPLTGAFGENLPPLTALILTNLILVEYLFAYKGLVFYLLYFYQRHDASSFISISLALLLLYTGASVIGRGMALLFQPMKTRRLT